LCIYIHNDVCFNYPDFSKYCKEKILEMCEAQIETTDKQIIVIRVRACVCVCRSPSGDFNHSLRLLNMALLSLNKPSTETLMFTVY